MKSKLSVADLQRRENQLQNEILSIQDEIEILLQLLESRESELGTVRERLSLLKQRVRAAA